MSSKLPLAVVTSESPYGPGENGSLEVAVTSESPCGAEENNSLEVLEVTTGRGKFRIAPRLRYSAKPFACCIVCQSAQVQHDFEIRLSVFNVAIRILGLSS